MIMNRQLTVPAGEYHHSRYAAGERDIMLSRTAGE
jgi:hypothetical protein